MTTPRRTRPARLLLPLLTAALAACSAMSGPQAAMEMAPARAQDGILVTAAGMSLYTFDKDPADASKSVCNGPCATNWPPLAAAADASAHGHWKPVTRDDGSRQWAYKGKPLYRWIKDQKPGERSGDGVNNVWRLARP